MCFFFLATGPVSLQINDLSDPPKKQDSVNEVREKFTQLRRLREELQNALFRWILIRETTIRLLKSLAVLLKDVGSRVTVQNGLFCRPNLVPTVAVAAIPFISAIMMPSFLSGALATAAGSVIFSTIGTIMGLHDAEKMVGRMLGFGFDEVQASIMEDQEACLEIQQQLDSLENFISTLAEFLIHLNDNAVLLKEMGESGFEFLYKWIACEDMDPSTVTKVEFCAEFLRAATSASTISSSIPAAKSATVFVSEVSRAVTVACIGEAIWRESRANSSADLTSDLFPRLKEMSSLKHHFGSVSMMEEDIRLILNELECPDEEEIQGLVQSFIEGSFNKAYRLIESYKQRE